MTTEGFLREVYDALKNRQVKRLGTNAYRDEKGNVCTLGAYLETKETYIPYHLVDLCSENAELYDVTREIVKNNDEFPGSMEERYTAMVKYIEEKLGLAPAEPIPTAEPTREPQRLSY